MFLDCDLSALFARSTLTKYHFDCSQYHWSIKPVETPESALASCSAKFTCSQNYLYVYCNVNCKTFWPPRETCKSINKSGEVVAGQVSNGDFHCESPNDVLATEPVKQDKKKSSVSCYSHSRMVRECSARLKLMQLLQYYVQACNCALDRSLHYSHRP
jgi:hypothetical protein